MTPVPDPADFVRRHAAHLVLVLIGPGFGESALVRAPGADWIVVDGCEHAGESLPARFLAGLGARAAAVVLTHPHDDHVRGLPAVYELTAPDALLGCYAPLVGPSSPWRTARDPQAELIRGSREHALATIQDRWERVPSSRWDLVSGCTRSVGGATLVALHPPEGTPAPPREQANALCNAVLLTWNECRLLLGADLEHAGWASVAERHGALQIFAHAGAKVPHHGSAGALHEVWCDGARGRVWALTPWNRGRKLPRFEDGEGLDRMLAHVDRVHLTGLPVAHDAQDEAPCRTSRRALRDGTRPVPRTVEFFPGLTLEEVDVAPAAELRCWIAAAFAPDGTLVEIEHGKGSLEVEEAR